MPASTNWQFNAGVGSVSFTGTSPSGADLTAASVAVAASTITVTLSTDSNANKSDSMTITGIQVRPTDGSGALPSSGSILRTAGNSGTATIAGITNGTTNFGSLSMAAGAARLAITSVNGGLNPTTGTAFSVTVTKQDQFGHAINAVAATGVSLSLDTGTGTLGGTLTGTIAVGTSSTSISGVTYTKAESGVVLTATRTSGDTPLPAGNSAGFTVNPGALANFLVEAAGGGNIGTQAAGTSFNIRVIARDANGNTVTSYNGAGNTVNITSTGTLSGGLGNDGRIHRGRPVVARGHDLEHRQLRDHCNADERRSRERHEQLLHGQSGCARELPRRGGGRRRDRHPDRRFELQRPHHREGRERRHG